MIWSSTPAQHKEKKRDFWVFAGVIVAYDNLDSHMAMGGKVKRRRYLIVEACKKGQSQQALRIVIMSDVWLKPNAGCLAHMSNCFMCTDSQC